MAYDYSLVEFIKSRGKVVKEELLIEYALIKNRKEDSQLNKDLKNLLNNGCIEFDGTHYCFRKGLG